MLILWENKVKILTYFSKGASLGRIRRFATFLFFFKIILILEKQTGGISVDQKSISSFSETKPLPNGHLRRDKKPILQLCPWKSEQGDSAKTEK